MMESEILQVLYDYSYEYKEKQISIVHDEKLKLLQRTNQHWWKVVRPNQNRPFFVPAQYVQSILPSPAELAAQHSQHSSGEELSSEGESPSVAPAPGGIGISRQDDHEDRSENLASANSSPSTLPKNFNNNSYKIQHSPSLRVSSSSKQYHHERHPSNTDSMKMKRADSSRASKRALKVKNWSASLEELSKQIVFPGLSAENVMNLSSSSPEKTSSQKEQQAQPQVPPKHAKPLPHSKQDNGVGGKSPLALNTSNTSSSSGSPSPGPATSSKPVPLPRRVAVNEFHQKSSSSSPPVVASPKPVPKARSKTILCDSVVSGSSSNKSSASGGSSEVLNSSCDELDMNTKQSTSTCPKLSTFDPSQGHSQNNSSTTTTIKDPQVQPQKSPELTTFTSCSNSAGTASGMKPKSTILTIPAAVASVNNDRRKSLSTDSVNSTGGCSSYGTISSTTSIHSYGGSTKPPKPGPDEKPIRLLLDSWGEYAATVSTDGTSSSTMAGGRHYYYNHVTGATSWKPPRINSLKADSSGTVTASNHKTSTASSINSSQQSQGFNHNNNHNNQSHGHSTKVRVGSGGSIRSGSGSIGGDHFDTLKSNQQQHSHSVSEEDELSQEEQLLQQKSHVKVQTQARSSQFPVPPVPDGWTCSIDTATGQPVYINDVTGAKWLSSQDPQGKIYYYEENSAKSSWFLPVPGISVNNDESSSSAPLSKSTTSDSLDGGRETTPPKGSTGNMPDVVNSLGGGGVGGIVKKRFSTGDSDRFLKARSLIVLEPRRGLEPTKVSSLPRSPPKSIWNSSNCVDDGAAAEEGLIPLTVMKEGNLSRTRITENGKKVRKNWSTSYVVLTEKHLSLFKDSKSFVNTASRKSEMEIELTGCNLAWASDKSSRKNVFQLNTSSDFQILFQTDDKELAGEWFDKIAYVVDNQQSDPILRLRSTSPDAFLDAPIGEKKNSTSRLGRAKSTKVKITGSVENLTSEERYKIRAQLKKFFNRRPPRESLVRKGIYKDEAVFGCHLEKLCAREETHVPRFVKECIRAIESKEENLRTDGIYRASGNLSQVQKLRLQVDQNNLNCLYQEEDVHVLAGSLKLFFREMKEPLIPSDLFDRALEASHLRKDRVSRFRDIVSQLAKSHRNTLNVLLKHLLKVSEYSEFNRMQIPNLAIVFGPTLMWPAQESTNMALDLMQQNFVIEALLQDYEAVFEKK